MKTRQRAKLISFLPLASAIGFALPILAQPECGDLLVQEVDERRGTVKGFRPLVVGELPTIPIEKEVFVQEGEPQIYVFVARGGDALCGTLEELVPNLRSCAEELGKQADIQLQIFELIGSEDEKRVARAAVQDRIVETLGQRSAQFFLNASLRGELWDLLLDAAPDDDAAGRILSVRSRISANFDEAGEVHLDLRGLDQRDLQWIDVDLLCSRLKDRFAFPNTMLSVTSKVEERKEEEDGDELFHGIAAARQEERMVLLLQALFSDAEYAWKLANTYVPRTLFEQRSMQVIKRHFEPHALPGLSAEKIAHYCAFRIFSEVYPRNRGRYLLYLARHLGANDEVAGFIRDKLSRSNAIDVAAYRDEIAEALSLHEGI